MYIFFAQNLTFCMIIPIAYSTLKPFLAEVHNFWPSEHKSASFENFFSLSRDSCSSTKSHYNDIHTYSCAYIYKN